VLLLLLLPWACTGTATRGGTAPNAAPRTASHRIPVILDTDIGDDIDDTWALGLLLQSPELDLVLAVGDHGKNLYRARLLAKFLESAGRTDVAVGIGADVNAQGDGPQAAWLQGYDLNRYPGVIRADGVRAIVDAVMASVEPVTIIAIGPLPNLAAALRLEPAIAGKARIVGMHGSVFAGYDGSRDVHAEYNVKADARSCQQVFAAAWPITITPLDTCGLVSLQGDAYRAVLAADNPVCRAIAANYRIWADAGGPEQQRLFASRSTTLFDTVAVYLAIEESLTAIESVNLRVTDDGFTRLDATGRSVRIARSWRDRPAFERWLAHRLTGG
jgi:inosine-uridine nucleoside N-ribohydrolase